MRKLPVRIHFVSLLDKTVWQSPCCCFPHAGREGRWFDPKGKFLCFISEFNVLQALEDGKNLNQLTAEDLMAKDRVPITAYTTIAEAVKIMGKSRFLTLPVERDGIVIGCITRHDLLHAWIGIGLGLGLEGPPW